MLSKFVKVYFIFCIFLWSCSAQESEPVNAEVNFSVNRKQAIAGESLFFNNSSTGNPTSWEWTFEGGTPKTSTEKNPKVAYLNPGSFDVKLEVTYSDGKKVKTEPKLINVLKRTEPPYSGTIFIEKDIITEADPSSFVSITSKGIGRRTMYDRRVNNWVELDAHLFEVKFEKRTVEAQVNPEFSSAMALSLATKYSKVIGRLPHFMLKDVETLWIHDGLNPFGGGNKNLLIHTKQADEYEKDGILEETFVHEASHTSLDEYHANAAGWVAAQKNDPTFISTYARDNPQREDVAETFLFYLAIKIRADKIKDANKNLIHASIPNRLKYFDGLNLDFAPLK